MTKLLVGGRAAAEDIVQETLAKAYLNWHKLWPDGNPGGWCYRVATNLSRSWWRGVIRERKAFAKLDASAETEQAGSSVDLELQVRRLPKRQRTAVALFYTSDLPIEDVAQIMGCKPATVRVLLHQARERLRKEMGSR